MSGRRDWYLVCYDIRDPARWRKVYKIMQGSGERLQYSIFRCRLSRRDIEKLRWRLSEILDPEDSILLVGLCNNCIERIPLLNRPEEWSTEDKRYAII